MQIASRCPSLFSLRSILIPLRIHISNELGGNLGPVGGGVGWHSEKAPPPTGARGINRVSHSILFATRSSYLFRGVLNKMEWKLLLKISKNLFSWLLCRDEQFILYLYKRTYFVDIGFDSFCFSFILTFFLLLLAKDDVSNHLRIYAFLDKLLLTVFYVCFTIFKQKFFSI